MDRRFWSLALLIDLCCGLPSQTNAQEPAGWRVFETEHGWQLRKDGQPFYIKGAVGWNRFDVLHNCGGNAARAPAKKEVLDRAHAEGLAVMANLPVRGERSGFRKIGRWLADEEKGAASTPEVF